MRNLSGAAARTGNMKKQDIKKYYKNRMLVVVQKRQKNYLGKIKSAL